MKMRVILDLKISFVFRNLGQGLCRVHLKAFIILEYTKDRKRNEGVKYSGRGSFLFGKDFFQDSTICKRSTKNQIVSS